MVRQVKGRADFCVKVTGLSFTCTDSFSCELFLFLFSLFLYFMKVQQGCIDTQIALDMTKVI